MALLAAATALQSGDQAGYTEQLAALGVGATDGEGGGAALGSSSSSGGGGGKVTATAQVLEVLLDRVIEEVWRQGWQPADVERMVRRQHGGDHAAAAAEAIAHQHRRYAAATVSASWQAQLRAIGADPWGSPAEERSGAVPFDDVSPAATGAPAPGSANLRRRIEVLSVLLTLPTLPLLGPLPGEASANGATGSGREVDGRVLERVRALLAKAESTTFVGEAEAFTAKAQELMARHAVDRAMVEGAHARSGGPGGRRIPTDDPYAQAKSLLLDAVAGANRCRTVWSGSLGFSTVFGHEAELEGVELLYTSLLVQATRAVASAGPQLDRWGRSSTRSFRKSFYVAYATRIGQRLQESTAAAEAAGADAHGDALLPVLAARDRAVDHALDEAFPSTTKCSVSVSSGAGWIAGTSAADQARLNPSAEVERRQASV